MKTSISIINYNLPHFIYRLLQSIRKMCSGDYVIDLYDVSEYRPIINHIDDINKHVNKYEGFISIDGKSGLEIYRETVKHILLTTDADKVIILDAKSLLTRNILTREYLDDDISVGYFSKSKDAVSDDMLYVNIRRLRENNFEIKYDSNDDTLYNGIVSSLPSTEKCIFSIHPYIRYFDETDDSVIDWFMKNSKYWKTEYYDVIVSLTTYYGRIYDDTTYDVLVSLLTQKTKYNYKVVLVLSEEEFGRNYILPGRLTHLLELWEGKFEILWTYKDTKPLKKLDPTMEKYSNLPIITLDDDDICEYNMVECLMDAHFLDPYFTLGTWVEHTPNFIKWVAGVRLFPPKCLYDFPLEDYYTYYDGMLDDNFNAMRCAFNLTPVKGVESNCTHKHNQTDLKLARDYGRTDWGRYYRRFIMEHMSEIPPELYYE